VKDLAQISNRIEGTAVKVLPPKPTLTCGEEVQSDMKFCVSKMNDITKLLGAAEPNGEMLAKALKASLSQVLGQPGAPPVLPPPVPSDSSK
jgi:hypothetical protein